MRTLSSAAVVAVTAAASLLLAPTAQAAFGDNGTVKIHDAGTGEELRKNEPKVCSFYLDAFGFDSAQEVTWKIVEKSQTGPWGEPVADGTLTLDDEGHGRTEDMNLDDGHYKLIWNFEGELGLAKHKVFKTDCADMATDEEESKESTDSADSTEEAPASESEPKPNGGGDLAETGSSVPAGALAAGAAALLGAGGYLVLRRRKVGRE